MLNSTGASLVLKAVECFRGCNSEALSIILLRLKDNKCSPEDANKAIQLGLHLGFFSLADNVVANNTSIVNKHQFYQEYIKKCILIDRIHEENPQWNIISYGRRKFLDKLCETNKNLYQLLRYANLTEGTSSDVVAWWDEFAALFRQQDDDKKLLTGRKGEELSLAYEKAIVNNLAVKYKLEARMPVWESVDNNDSGYDIGSFTVFENNWCDKKVEVKSSESDYGIFSFSRNQYKTMRTFNKTYEVHLWKLKTQELAVLTYEDLSPHMPIDQGKGSWSAVDIHFSEFKHKFFVPDLAG